MADEPGPLSEYEAAALDEEPTRVRLAPSQVFSVRFSADELRRVVREAAAAGLTVGALVKKATLDAAERHAYSRPANPQYGFSSGGGRWYKGRKQVTYEVSSQTYVELSKPTSGGSPRSQ